MAQLSRKCLDPSRPLYVGLLVCAVLQYLTNYLRQQFENGETYSAACAALAGNLAYQHKAARGSAIDAILSICDKLNDAYEKVQGDAVYQVRYDLPATPVKQSRPVMTFAAAQRAKEPIASEVIVLTEEDLEESPAKRLREERQDLFLKDGMALL